MSLYLPHLHSLAGIFGLAITLIWLSLLGRLITGPSITGSSTTPETRLIAGWGLFCLILTFAAMIGPYDLRLTLAGLGVLGIGVLITKAPNRRIAGIGGLRRVFLLMLPLWLVMLPLRPSQIDTWLNLLPNAAYLYDYGVLPIDGRPDSHSFLPGAPYNTQFVAFAASVLSGGFADGVMGLFNIALQGMAVLLLARIIAAGAAAESRSTPPWWALALGFLVVIPLNPGFVPRIFFASYGEAGLAVTLVFAVWLSALTIEDLAAGKGWPEAGLALAFVLAAMVNIKQSAIGQVVAIALPLYGLVLAHKDIKTRSGLLAVSAILLPSLALYGGWRLFVLSHFTVGELKPLPFAQWNWVLLPQIFSGMAWAMFEKPLFFLVEFGSFGFALWHWRRAGCQREGLLLLISAAVLAIFSGFIVFTYIAHFPPDWAIRAHSYFRYQAQLSLVIMLILVLGLRPLVQTWISGQTAQRRRRFGQALIGLVLVLPILTVRLLRFDLDEPQPELWKLGTGVARVIAPDAHLALLLPGDSSDGVGSLLRGVLLFAPPRRPGLTFRMADTADAATLAAVLTEGFPTALVSCMPEGLVPDVPAGVAALLQHEDTGWHASAIFPYPPNLPQRRFSAMLARGPVCADKRRDP